MIPVSLEFSGLNSYRDEQRIDFSQLMSQGLFGIFGVTGAGKSTVLDAMTLALFGQVKRAPNRTQGIINAREKRCRVQFTFELSGRRYTAERVFERVKGDPYSCAIKSCRLAEDDSLVLADKNRVMDEEIVKLLNMDCERFCQTVILPQGQFDQLLHMKPRDRSSMLEELFHYEDYGEALVRRCRERLKSVGDQASALDEKMNMLGPCSAEDLERLRKDLEQTRQRSREVADLSGEAERELRRLEALAEQKQEFDNCRQELARLDEKADDIADLRAEAKAAAAAEPLRHALDEAVALNSQTNEARLAFDAAQQGRNAAAAADEEVATALKYALDELERQAAGIKPRLHDLELAAADKEAAEETRRKLQEAVKQLENSGLAAAVAELENTVEQVGKERTHIHDSLAKLRQKESSVFDRWEQAVEAEKTAQRQNAAVLLAAGLREGEPCPVCGSIHHQTQPHQTADLKAASEFTKQARADWEKLRKEREGQESASQKLAAREKELTASWQEKKDELDRVQSQISVLEGSLAEKDARWQQRAGCDDPQEELLRLQDALAAFEKQAEESRQKRDRAQADLNTADLELGKARTALEERSGRLSALRQQLLHDVEQAGFASANDARLALRGNDRRQGIAAEVKAYDDELLRQQQEYGRLDQALRGFDPAALTPARELAFRLADEQKELLNSQGRLERDLEKAQEDAVKAADIAAQLHDTRAQADVLRRLSNLLKGNAFVRYLARGTMLELAHESSDILLSLTAGRYRLELTEDGGSDFILVDNNGGIRRQISGLSGGETFLVSLALALALSGKIQMHAAPLGFFFLDEGFGSLDGASLEAAMAVLEKLPSDKRAVGLITHVREVRERVPRYLEVTSDPVRGSRIELKMN